METPTTLQAAVEYFSDPERCHAYVVAMRWPLGVCCPTCGSLSVRSFTSVVKPRPNAKKQVFKTRHLFECKEALCGRQFTTKTGSVFEDSPIPMKSWMLAMWMIVNCKNGISSYELHRALGVTQKSAWFMLHRLRLAMQDGTSSKFNGDVEIDETFIGGKAKFMHKHKRERLGITKFNSRVGKIAVMGLLERHTEKQKSRVRAHVIPNLRKHHVQPHVDRHIQKGSRVHTDSLPTYERVLQNDYIHGVIDHAEKYVDGIVHTNSLENFWSLLKRTLKGTYVSVDAEHLHRYLDEQSFRFNKRVLSDGERFALAFRGVIGKRLKFNDLISQAGAMA